jgi:prolyl-tRNA synthetase
MDAIGGQELSLPVVHPAEIWRSSGRYQTVGPEMTRFQDREGRDLVLAMTHEEVVAQIAHHLVRSWRDLPRLVYQIQTKWRDDPRPRAGLIRVREFTMKDSYSLDANWEGLERQYEAHRVAYARIFKRCGLPVMTVRSDVGMMGGRSAHEYMYLTPVGEDTLLVCHAAGCGYTANRQVARFRCPAVDGGPPRSARKVATPGASTIADLARHLGVEPNRTAKAVFLMSPGRLVFAVVRGDLEVNETKLAHAAGVSELRPAQDEEIRAAGAVPGFASPVGIRRGHPTDALVIVDESVAATTNLVAGANEEGYHLMDT